MLGFLLRRTEPAADAADVRHDILVAAWRRIDGVPDDAAGTLAD